MWHVRGSGDGVSTRAPFECGLAAVPQAYTDRDRSSPPTVMSAAVSGDAMGSRTARIAASRFDLPASASPTRAHSGPGENATSRALRKPLTSTRVTPKLAWARLHTRQRVHAPPRYVCPGNTTSTDERAWWATRSLTLPSAFSPCSPRLPTTRRSADSDAATRTFTAGSPCSSSLARSLPPLRGRARPSSTPQLERCRRTGRRPRGRRRARRRIRGAVHACNDRLRPRFGVARRPGHQHRASGVAKHPRRHRAEQGPAARPARVIRRRPRLPPRFPPVRAGPHSSPSRSFAVAEGAIARASVSAASASCCRSSAAWVAAMPACAALARFATADRRRLPCSSCRRTAWRTATRLAGVPSTPQRMRVKIGASLVLRPSLGA